MPYSQFTDPTQRKRQADPLSTLTPAQRQAMAGRLQSDRQALAAGVRNYSTPRGIMENLVAPRAAGIAAPTAMAGVIPFSSDLPRQQTRERYMTRSGPGADIVTSGDAGTAVAQAKQTVKDAYDAGRQQIAQQGILHGVMPTPQQRRIQEDPSMMSDMAAMREGLHGQQFSPEQRAAAQQDFTNLTNRMYNSPIDRAQIPYPIGAQRPKKHPAEPDLGAEVAVSQPGQQQAPEGDAQRIENRIIRDGNSFSANGPIREGATIGSTDMLQPGQADDGRALGGRFSVGEPGDAQLAMERWARASQIRDLTNMERRNPNPLTIIRDESRGGFEGERNRVLNMRDAARRQERTDQHRQDISQARQSILDGMEARQDREYQQGREALQDQLMRQQIDQGAMSIQQQQQLAELRQRMSDPNLSPEERAAAERAFLAMSGVTGRDRYFQDETIIDYGPDGNPVRGKVTIDSLTGRRISQEALQKQAAQEEAHREARKAVAEGKNKKMVNDELTRLGFTTI